MFSLFLVTYFLFLCPHASIVLFWSHLGLRAFRYVTPFPPAQPNMNVFAQQLSCNAYQNRRESTVSKCLQPLFVLGLIVVINKVFSPTLAVCALSLSEGVSPLVAANMTANSTAEVFFYDCFIIWPCLRVHCGRLGIFCLDMFPFYLFIFLIASDAIFQDRLLCVLDKERVSQAVSCRNRLCYLQDSDFVQLFVFVFGPIGCGCILASCLLLKCLVCLALFGSKLGLFFILLSLE